ncbi:hypothetical protein TNCV_1347431 [Trichonephila clavipes]|nr:hypothetical protein TNCV_1347431 [Trichonephila clavipes]
MSRTCRKKFSLAIETYFEEGFIFEDDSIPDRGRHWDEWKRACHKLMLLEHLKWDPSATQRQWDPLKFKDYVSKRRFWPIIS